MARSIARSLMFGAVVRHSPFALCVIVSGTHLAIAQTDVEKLLAESNPAIQDQIEATAGAFLGGRDSESEMKTNWKGFRELAKLKELADDEEQLISFTVRSRIAACKCFWY